MRSKNNRYDENTTEYQSAKQQQSSKQHSGIFRFFARKHPARDSIARWRRSGGFACGANISGTPAASDRSCLRDRDGESQLHPAALADQSAANLRQPSRAVHEQPHHAGQSECGAGFFRHGLLQRGHRSPSVRAQLCLGGSGNGFWHAYRRRSESGKWQYLRRSTLDRAIERGRHSVEELSGRRSIGPQPNPTARRGPMGRSIRITALRNTIMPLNTTRWRSSPTRRSRTSIRSRNCLTTSNNNTVGRYNWITPDQYNDAHSSLTGGFTYNGTHYTGDRQTSRKATTSSPSRPANHGFAGLPKQRRDYHLVG